MFSKLKVLLLILFILALVAVPFLPGRYPQRIARKINRQWLIMTGGMHDVGDGLYLRIECRGSGGPTVVFDSGFLQPRKEWGTVPTEVAKTTRVCTYDRAGVGESDRAGYVRTSADAVRELRILLSKAGETEPFVLVAHSFGGLNARLFAGAHSDEVSALVLVDPSHEDQFQRIAAALPTKEADEFLRRESGDNDERMDMLRSAELVRNLPIPDSVPVILLSAQPPAEPDGSKPEDISDLHAQLMAKITCGEHLTLPQTGHFIQLERPDIVIGAVTRVIGKPTLNCAPPKPELALGHSSQR